MMKSAVAICVSVISAAFVILISIVVIRLAAGKTEISDADRYGEYADYVSGQLSSEFVGTLPSSISDSMTVDSYYYTFDGEVYGDPSFIIRLDVTFADNASYEAEKQRLEKPESKRTEVFGIWTYYVYTVYEKAFDKYFADEVYDGCFFHRSLYG